MTKHRSSRPSTLRCPACGQRLESPLPTTCSLCHYDFGDDRATGADVTPFAKSYTHGQSGRWAMTNWTWFAGVGRLKHLALMRTSAASRRFARINILLLSFLFGLFQWTRVGWKWMAEVDGAQADTLVKPAGEGWFHVASVPRPIPLGRAIELPIDLWWNAAQSLVAVVSGMIVAFILIVVVQSWLRQGITLFHDANYRQEQRMTAALEYGTAWSFWIIIAVLILLLTPIAFVGEILSWRWCPTANGFMAVAGVYGGAGMSLWWIWLIRLGACAPASCRSRVILFCALATPLLVTAAACIWHYGLDLFYDAIFPLMKLSV